ncbi:MAG: ERF family protein [Pseudomonadota bacterium]
MSSPSVYAAINAVSAELAQHGIAKAHINQADDYKYRSIDDLLDRLAPLLAKHRLCVFPKALERTVLERKDETDHSLFHVSLKVAFTLTSVDDGSSQTITAYGEALDGSDKATAKAMSAAYKSAMVQTFCIPLAGTDDPDQSSPRTSARTHIAEPVQGWVQWARDIEDIVSLCESEQAITLVQERNRDLLKALSCERADLYRQLGEAFGSRREVLQRRTSASTKTAPSARPKTAPLMEKAKPRTGKSKRERQDA